MPSPAAPASGFARGNAIKTQHLEIHHEQVLPASPEIPLHTNTSERDIRDYVKRRKVSGGTRSDLGRRSRDTFASLKKTCRKLGISFWRYLQDRVSGQNVIAPLSTLIEQHAKAS